MIIVKVHDNMLLFLRLLVSIAFAIFVVEANSTIENSSLTNVTSFEQCSKPWPSLEIFLPVYLSENETVRNSEWYDVFLRSFLLFWPVQRSNTSIRVVLDEDVEYLNVVKESVDSFISSGTNNFGSAFPKIYKTFNKPIKGVYKTGHDRQQYLMFTADLYTNATYIAFVDTDAFFHSYVDVDDIFDGKKPIIHGTIGYMSKVGKDKIKRDWAANTLLALVLFLISLF